MKILMSLASALYTILGIYSFLIIAAVILSYFRTQDFRLDSFRRFLNRITDPYVRLFRNRKNRSRIDFSPVWAMAVISAVRSVLYIFSYSGRLTVLQVIVVVYDSLWRGFISYLLLILVAILIYRLVLEKRYDEDSVRIKNMLDSGVLYTPVMKVFNAFFKGKNVSDYTLVRASLITYCVLWAVGFILKTVLYALI